MAASLIIIDPVLTVTLLIVVVFVFICQYPSNIRGANYGKLFEDYAGRSNKILNDFIDSLFNVKHTKKDKKNLVKNFFLKTELKHSINGFSGRVKVLEESTLINQIGTALVLSLSVLIVGYRLIYGKDQNWGLLLAYIVSLRVAMHGVVSVGRALTSVSRFYPQIVRQYHLDMTNSMGYYEQIKLVKGERIYIDKNKNTDLYKNNFIVKIPNKIAIYTIDKIDRKIFFILHNFVVDKKEERKVGLDRNPFYCNNILECKDLLEKINTDTSDGIEIVFIKHSILQRLSPCSQEKLFRNTLMFIIYDELRSPVFKEDYYIFWSTHKIHSHLVRNENDDEKIIGKIKKCYFYMKHKKKTSSYEDEFEDDDDV